MKKLILTNSHIDAYISKLCREISNSGWKPDYVVGLTRGGLVPAVMMSQWFNVPMETLKVSLRDGGECETNCWMPEDAFGYIDVLEQQLHKSRWDINKRKNILIVDDINDTGATLEWIKQDWQKSCLPNESSWETVWNHNVRFAVIVENLSSSFKTDYHSIEINKAEDDVWVEYPWENWWTK